MIRPLCFCILMGFCILFSGCGPFFKMFYADPVKSFQSAQSKKPYDVIIVPGCPFEKGKTNTILTERILWADYLYRNAYTKHIIFSGSAVYSPYVEGETMRLFALNLGIKPEYIFVESKAEHTSENLYYSYVLAKKLGFNTMAFATQTMQASPLKNLARKLEVDLLPIITDSIHATPFLFDSVDISKAMITGFVSIVDRESLLKRLGGTRGHRVKVAMRKAQREKRKEGRK